jgi:hypothetical protein
MDEIDTANEQAEGMRTIALALVRSKKPLVPKGLCYNCDAEVKAGINFCDPYCRDDYDKRETYETKIHR